ncbi:hypothetical protein [Phytohabitans aurantiacus]|nr:hypothetical protein [Phytohabitans aurantiacus]
MMDTHADSRALSRRRVIGGLGVVGAGTLVSGTAVLATGSAATAAPPIPTDVAAPGPRTEVVGYLDFWPLESAAGYVEVRPTTGRFGRGPAAGFGGVLVAPVRLPAGSTITTVRVRVRSGAGPATVRLESTDVSTGEVTVLSQGTVATNGIEEFVVFPVTIPYGNPPLRIAADLPPSGAVYGAEVVYTPVASRHFVPIAAQRRLDTRQTGGIVTPGQIRTVAFDDLPDNVTAVALNLTLTGTTGGGWLAGYPAGGSTGGTSTVNWTASGQTIANSTTVGLGSNRQVALTTGGTGNTHVIVDLLGYHLSA